MTTIGSDRQGFDRVFIDLEGVSSRCQSALLGTAVALYLNRRLRSQVIHDLNTATIALKYSRQLSRCTCNRQRKTLADGSGGSLWLPEWRCSYETSKTSWPMNRRAPMHR